MALRNITVDDADSMLSYSGGWAADARHADALDYGGIQYIEERDQKMLKCLSARD
jgi:hypothetical protein